MIPPPGNRKLQTVGIYASKTEAQREGARAVEQRQRGTLLQPTDMTVGELLDLWLAQEMPKTVRPENQEPYRIVVAKHLKPALGSIRVQRLSVQAIESFYGRLARCRVQLVPDSQVSPAPVVRAQAGQSVGVDRRESLRRGHCAEADYKEPEVWTPVETARFLQRRPRTTACIPTGRSPSRPGRAPPNCSGSAGPTSISIAEPSPSGGAPSAS